MSWNLEGLRVEGGYLSGDIRVSGKVVLSRVQYGGVVQHTIVLDEGFSILGGAVKRDAGERVLVEHPFIYRILGSN